MSAVLVDSNVVLDVMTMDERWFGWSAETMERVANRYRLVINPIIYAEVSVRFSKNEDLDAVLPRTSFDRETLADEAAFLAGKCYSSYRARGGTKCSPLLDFFIGAHAAVAGYRLMTRDASRY